MPASGAMTTALLGLALMDRRDRYDTFVVPNLSADCVGPSGGREMTAFTTRVELHDAAYDEYETLHDEMEQRGFTRTITAGDGTEYHLPWAEYNYLDDRTKEGILALARAAAAETGRRYAVLVTESSGRTWHGLDNVQPGHRRGVANVHRTVAYARYPADRVVVHAPESAWRQPR